MKVKLEFDLNDFSDKNAHKRVILADSAYIALRAIANEIFRPNRKHGYSDAKMKYLIENAKEIDLDDEKVNPVEMAIDTLEDKFYEILKEYSLNLDDLE